MGGSGVRTVLRAVAIHPPPTGPRSSDRGLSHCPVTGFNTEKSDKCTTNETHSKRL